MKTAILSLLILSLLAGGAYWYWQRYSNPSPPADGGPPPSGGMPRNWTARLFGECLAINPNDKPSQLYVERAEHLKENPPPDDWAGVWVMTSK